MGRGKLPVTEKIVLESGEDQWRLLVKGLINELQTSALIEIESNHKIRINILIKKIIPPECLTGGTVSYFETNMNQTMNNGLARTDEFFIEILRKSLWIFFGYINGDKEAPILITHYKLINISVYTQKLKTETSNSFSTVASLN